MAAGWPLSERIDVTDGASFLRRFLEAECAEPAFERVYRAARDIADHYGEAVAGILFYGSCRRSGEDRDKIVDFYVICDNYRALYRQRAPAFWNRLLPPNVYYRETGHRDGLVRTKYNIISLRDLRRMSRVSQTEVLVWGRLCQPCSLVYSRDPRTQAQITDALVNSVVAMVSAAAPLFDRPFTARDLWEEGFRRSYGAELRSESPGKAREIFEQYAPRYRSLTAPALEAAGFELSVEEEESRPLYSLGGSAGSKTAARCRWFWRRINGKFFSLLRLIKGAFTFDGGIDYLAWKIRRHSGVEIDITPWQRRHPILAGFLLFLRLRRHGAFR